MARGAGTAQAPEVGPTPPPVAFDEAGCPVPAVDFVYPGEGAKGERETEEMAIRSETAQRLLAFLASSNNTRKVSGRTLTLAYLCGVGRARTQKELADGLGISPAAVSKKVNSLRCELRTLA